jgi:hypothetical protein
MLYGQFIEEKKNTKLLKIFGKKLKKKKKDVYGNNFKKLIRIMKKFIIK